MMSKKGSSERDASISNYIQDGSLNVSELERRSIEAVPNEYPIDRPRSAPYSHLGYSVITLQVSLPWLRNFDRYN